MTKESDELADALTERLWVIGYIEETEGFVAAELRTLAREAEAMGAKKALEDAADAVAENGITMDGARTHWTTNHWLRARAEQIGKDSE